MRVVLRMVAAALLVVAGSGPVQAQSDAPVGVRAAGMAGAFVAVADDASAFFWNPAGFAAGSYFSLVIDRNGLETGTEAAAPRRRSGLLVAMGTPPLGVGYYRTSLVTLVENKNPGLSGDDFVSQSLTAHHIGVTLVQTIAPGLSVGATLKAVRGVTTGVKTNGRGGLLDPDDFPSRASTKFDTDLGLLASAGKVRAGLSVRNALEPSFATPGDTPAITLERRIRGGVALTLTPSVTLAADADFTRVETSGGRWRDAAIGVESRLSRRVWGRGGLHWNTAGAGGLGAAPVASVGGSVALRPTLLADAQVSVGSRNGDRGVGLAARIVF